MTSIAISKHAPNRFLVSCADLEAIVGGEPWSPDEIRSFMRRGPCNAVFFMIAEAHIFAQYRPGNKRVFARLYREMTTWWQADLRPPRRSVKNREVSDGKI